MGLFEQIIDKGNLSRAWDKIRSNHTVAGTDGVTEEEFQSRRKEMILQLQIELQSERYNTRPAKQVVLDKNGSERMISILCMRDKVLQQALCQELHKIYEETFADAAYAYRRGRSAIQAVEQIEQWIGTGTYSYFLKTDIAHFFDEIVQERLISYYGAGSAMRRCFVSLKFVFICDILMIMVTCMMRREESTKVLFCLHCCQIFI